MPVKSNNSKKGKTAGTRLKNGWFSSPAPAKKKRKKVTMTYAAALSAARKAGESAGDTGAFEPWLERKGLDDRSPTVIGKLREAFREGVTAPSSKTQSSKDEAPREAKEVSRYKGVIIRKVGDAFRVSIDPDSEFDSESEAKRFILAQRNPGYKPFTRGGIKYQWKGFNDLSSGDLIETEAYGTVPVQSVERSGNGYVINFETPKGTRPKHVSSMSAMVAVRMKRNPTEKKHSTVRSVATGTRDVISSTPDALIDIGEGVEALLMNTAKGIMGLAEKLGRKVTGNPDHSRWWATPGTKKPTVRTLGVHYSLADAERAAKDGARTMRKTYTVWGYEYVNGREIWDKIKTVTAASAMRNKRNPEPGANEMYEKFHGRPPKEILEFREEHHIHEWLAGLGTLVELKVNTVTGKDATIQADEVSLLASNEDGTQMYVVGGDQSLDLGALGFNRRQQDKEMVTVGFIHELTYRTEKDFENFETVDFFHQLSEDSGDVLPSLIYDVRSKLLSISGGSYHIKKPLVGTSPGIED